MGVTKTMSKRIMLRLGLLCSLLCLAALSTFHFGQAMRPRNVILICVDGCRADHLGCYGYSRNTSPVLDKLAREGILFEHSYSQGNESLLSHASLFSSLYPGEIAPLQYMRFALIDQVTLPKVLKAYGYRTGAFTGGGHVRKEFGFDGGFDQWTETPYFGTYYDSVPSALRWIEQNRDKAMFVFLHSYDTGRPYTTIPPFMHLYDPDYSGKFCNDGRRTGLNAETLDQLYNGKYYPDFKVKKTWTWTGLRPTDSQSYVDLAENFRHYHGIALSPQDINHIRAHYDGCVTMADTWLGIFFDRLRHMGLDETNTTIIVLADHGEDLMEHGFFNHRTTLHLTNIHVPMIVWGASVDPRLKGTRYTMLTENADVAPTILAMLGIKVPAGMRGQSLLPLLQWPQTADSTPKNLVGRDSYCEGILGMCSVINDRYELIVTGAVSASAGMIHLIESYKRNPGHFELYDLQKDPQQKVNLAGDASHQPEMAEMVGRLLSYERTAMASRASARSTSVDSAARAPTATPTLRGASTP